MLDDNDEKLSFDADEVGPGLGCTSPLHKSRIYSHVTKQTIKIVLITRHDRLTFSEYVFPIIIR